MIPHEPDDIATKIHNDSIRKKKIKKKLEKNGVFSVHGRLVQYSKKSLFIFD